MKWRHLWLVRAWSAAGLMTCSMIAAPAVALAEPEEPRPSSGAVSETVRVLDAKRAGDLSLELRGNGQDRVRVAIHNTSSKRLNVVLPPGLVAASTTGQAGGRGFQSMGLGAVGNQPGGFGQFRVSATSDESGLRSVAAADDSQENAVTVPAGKTVEMAIPAVCLNFGMPTPTPRDRFELMDVDDYVPDPRARKALRSLATMGTSHGVAQAAAWNVFNGVPFEAMTEQFSKVVNPHETSLAARFVETLDASGPSGLVDSSYMNEGRVFIQFEGEGALADDASRLAGSFENLHILGLPIRVIGADEAPETSAPALLVKVALSSSRPGETRGRLSVARATRSDGWLPLGKTTFSEGSTVSVLDGPGLARAIDRALASSFVEVKAVKKGTGSTTLKVENHLPFTLATVVIRASGSSGSPLVPFRGIGVGPARSALVPIQAAGGKIERVELNGF